MGKTRLLSQQERDRIVALCREGRTRNAIAKETGRSAGTVTAVAHSIGHVFGQRNLERAHEARRAYGAEWRAEFCKRLSQKAADLLAEMDGKYLVFNFGGRDNVYEEHTLEHPPTEAKLKTMQAIRLAMQTVVDIDRHDNQGDGEVSLVKQYLASEKARFR